MTPRAWLAMFQVPLIASLLVACAQSPQSPSASVFPLAGPFRSVEPFSRAHVGVAAPTAWEPWILSRFLAKTDYRIVDHEGERVLEAVANRSASGLLQPISVLPTEYSWLSWRWKVPQLIAEADNASRGSDDSPVRVIVAFDGDKSKLDFEDTAFAETVKFFSGREMPYATIQYIWENKLPRETVLENAKTARSKMLVVESGPTNTGRWLDFRRNIKADFERLFGEKPGPVIFVGVMTDSNATGSHANAFYGDIRLTRGD